MITFPRYFRPGATVTVSTPDKVPLLTAAYGLAGVGPRIKFELSKTLGPTADSGSVEIYGMDDAQRKLLATYWGEVGVASVDLLAGYEGVYPPLALGHDVRSTVTNGLDGTDRVVRIEMDDAGDALAEVQVSIPPALLTVQQMVDAAIAAFASAPRFNPALRPIIFAPHPSVGLAIARASPTPYLVAKSGRARDLLDEAARLTRSRWSVRDGLLYFSSLRLPTDPGMYVFPRTHWLSEASEDGKGMLRLTTVLDPYVQPGGQVGIVGREVPLLTEPYRVESVRYTGDTYGTAPFAMDLGLRSISA